MELSLDREECAKAPDVVGRTRLETLIHQFPKLHDGVEALHEHAFALVVRHRAAHDRPGHLQRLRFAPGKRDQTGKCGETPWDEDLSLDAQHGP